MFWGYFNHLLGFGGIGVFLLFFDVLGGYFGLFLGLGEYRSFDN